MYKNKKFISLLLMLTMMAALVGCKKADIDPNVSSEPNESQVSSVTSDNHIPDEDKKIILCFGDSITEGYGMKSQKEPYPAILQGKLGDGYKVYNAGVSGEKAAAIMSRSNTVEFCLGEDLLFEANDLTAKLSLVGGLVVTETGEQIEYKGMGNQLPINSVEIGGKKYELTKASGSYCVVRKEAENALLIPKGTPVKYDYSKYFDKCYCAVVLMGANDNDSGSDKLIEKYKAFGKNFERCIYITPFYYEDYSEKFDAAFGRNALNIKACFRGSAFEDYGIEKDRVSQHYINKTTGIPVIFTLTQKPDEVHLSALGYQVMGGEVYKRGVELGYWK